MLTAVVPTDAGYVGIVRGGSTTASAGLAGIVVTRFGAEVGSAAVERSSTSAASAVLVFVVLSTTAAAAASTPSSSASSASTTARHCFVSAYGGVQTVGYCVVPLQKVDLSSFESSSGGVDGQTHWQPGWSCSGRDTAFYLVTPLLLDSSKLWTTQ